jgi:uncharacterized membrane protein YczE
VVTQRSSSRAPWGRKRLGRNPEPDSDHSSYAGREFQVAGSLSNETCRMTDTNQRPTGRRRTRAVLGRRLTRRLIQLFVGLFLYGVSLAFVLRAGLGLAPWDVLHQGLGGLTGATVGTMVVAVSFAVLLLWVPLGQTPGFGTFANSVLVGISVDLTLTVLGGVTAWPVRVCLLVAGVLLNALATALYIGAMLGPGPRDGLMTGLARRTGGSIRLVRTIIEVAVLVVGWLLGGTVGFGTLLYAVAIGPVVHVLLPPLTVRLNMEQETG